jgi:myosin heavy subunit
MQEMAIHLRQAFKDTEAPADVQAFLEKAEKEYSRNNIKSLQTATKSRDHAQKALRDAVNAKKDHRLQGTRHVSEGIKIWEAQLESYRVHQATLSDHAAKARAEIETSRRILKEVSENTVKEGNLSIPQPIQEETEDATSDNLVDVEEQKLRDQLLGVLNACAGSLGFQVAAAERQVQEVSDDDREQGPHNKRPRSVEPAKPASTMPKQ